MNSVGRTLSLVLSHGCSVRPSLHISFSSHKNAHHRDDDELSEKLIIIICVICAYVFTSMGDIFCLCCEYDGNIIILLDNLFDIDSLAPSAIFNKINETTARVSMCVRSV